MVESNLNNLSILYLIEIYIVTFCTVSRVMLLSAYKLFILHISFSFSDVLSIAVLRHGNDGQ